MTAFYSGFKVFITSFRFILNLWHVWLSCGALQIIFAKFCIWGVFTWLSHLWSMCLKKMSTQSGGCRLTGKFVKVRLHHTSLWSVRSGKCPTKTKTMCWKKMKVMSPYCSFFVYSSRVQIVRLSSKCSWIVIRAVALQTLQRQDRRHGIQRHVMN